MTLFDPELTVPGGGPLAKVTAHVANLLHARAGRCDSDCQVSCSRKRRRVSWCLTVEMQGMLTASLKSGP